MYGCRDTATLPKDLLIKEVRQLREACKQVDSIRDTEIGNSVRLRGEGLERYCGETWYCDRHTVSHWEKLRAKGFPAVPAVAVLP